MKKQSELIDFKTNISLCLILGGAFGNLIDRFVRGGIIDFIRIYKFPIFNIADIFIVSGWILVVMFLIIFSGKNRGEIFEKQDENIRN
jgi:lipoprotein signal peptidase